MEEREAITPELVLVDPELRRRLLDTALRDPMREALLVASNTEGGARPWMAAPVRPPAARRKTLLWRRTVGKSAAQIATLMTGATLVIALPSLAFLPPRQQPSLVEPDTASPVAGSQITWDAAPAADYYAVEFMIRGRLVAVRTPSVPGVSVPPEVVSRGATWRVFAGFGAVSAHNTRGPIASGSIGPFVGD